MPIPDVLIDITNKHTVLSFTADLDAAASVLGGVLAEPEYWQFYVKGELANATAYQASIVWLVGHGLATHTSMLNNASQEIWTMAEIITWCNANKVLYLVDTACYPSARKAVVQTAPKRTFRYYCRGDDAVVKVIASYMTPRERKLTLEHVKAWWTGQNFSLAADKT